MPSHLWRRMVTRTTSPLRYRAKHQKNIFRGTKLMATIYKKKRPFRIKRQAKKRLSNHKNGGDDTKMRSALRDTNRFLPTEKSPSRCSIKSRRRLKKKRPGCLIRPKVKCKNRFKLTLTPLKSISKRRITRPEYSRNPAATQAIRHGAKDSNLTEHQGYGG